MRATAIKTTRYESGKFWVDIIETRTMYEAWLTRKCYGISTLMFGYFKKDMDFDTFVEVVEANLPEDKRIYDLECGVWEEQHA